jgi:hypothetical protein
MENMGIMLYNMVPDHTKKWANFNLSKENLKLFSCVMLFNQWMNFCLSDLTWVVKL